MRIIEPSIVQMTPPIDGMKYLKNIEIAGRTCYKSEDKITDDSAVAFVKRLIKNGHEAMIEHAPYISIKFICDRGISHEIVRHRLFSFAQESTRYCNYSKDEHISFILPCWFSSALRARLNDRTFSEPGDYLRLAEVEILPGERVWLDSMLSSERDYKALSVYEWTPQQARSVLPNSLKTEIVVTGNAREWRHFLKLRTAKDAHPQMREVATTALHMLCDQIPVLFDDLYYGEV